LAQKSDGGWRSVVRTILIAGAIAFTFRSFAFEPFNIPSGSMLPTLLVGDFLFVSKYSYGYSRHSLPWSLPLIPGRIFFTEPTRGDIAVFRYPADTSIDYIKRIVGLPGDTIQMKEGRLYINGQIVERTPAGTYEENDQYNRVTRLQRYIEELPNGVKHYILEHSDNEALDNTPMFTVPPGHYFTMGDNRDNSLDSRVQNRVGYVPKENLVGRAELLFFSIDTDSDNFGVYGVPGGIRWNRIFTTLSP
jgi:signal peptidase I